MIKTRSVLFVCTHNSARSFMAEYIGRARYPEINFRSAGVHPLGPDPGAVAVLAEDEIDTREHIPRSLGSLSAERFDLTVFLCRNAMNSAYSLPQSRETILNEFSVPPFSGPDGLSGFRELREELKLYIDEIVKLLP